MTRVETSGRRPAVVRSPTQPSVLSEACPRAAAPYRWVQRRILAENTRPERTSGSNLAIRSGVCTRMCGARAYEASSSARATGGAEATPRARAGFSGSCEVGRYGLDGAALLAGAGRSAARAAAVLVAPALGARQSGLAVWMTRYGQVQRASAPRFDGVSPTGGAVSRGMAPALRDASGALAPSVAGPPQAGARGNHTCTWREVSPRYTVRLSRVAESGTLSIA